MKTTSKLSVGFNLIEMVTVLLLVGVVTMVGLPRFLSFQASSQLAAFNAAAGMVKTHMLQTQDASSFTTLGAAATTIAAYRNYAALEYPARGNNNLKWMPVTALPIVTGQTQAQISTALNSSVSSLNFGAAAGYYQTAAQCAAVWQMMVANADGMVPADVTGGTTLYDSTYCTVNAGNLCNYVLAPFNHGGTTSGHGCYAAQLDGSGAQTGRFIVMDWYSMPIVTTVVVAASVTNPFLSTPTLAPDDPVAGTNLP